MREFVLDILRQVLVGVSQGVEPSFLQGIRTKRWLIMDWTLKTLFDVYRSGLEVKRGMIVKKYKIYQVGIVVKPDMDEDKFLLITCWKRGER